MMQATQTPARIAVSVTTASAIIGLPVSTIRFWCKNGKLPAHKAGKTWLIRVDELDKLTRADEVLSAK
jgi:excisionase family DNA binding protein